MERGWCCEGRQGRERVIIIMEIMSWEREKSAGWRLGGRGVGGKVVAAPLVARRPLGPGCPAGGGGPSLPVCAAQPETLLPSLPRWVCPARRNPLGVSTAHSFIEH